MKNPFLGSAFLAALLALPLVLQAQVQRPIIISDAEYDARMDPELMRQRLTAEELQCLQNTTTVLVQSFASHCKARRIPANSLEGELLRALTDLNTDVTHLANDIRGRCGKTGRVDLAHVYRTFHMTEYASSDAQTVAAQAGYVRSLSSYFQDIDSHIEQLGRAGFRNPRLRRIEMESPYVSGRGLIQERQIILPPVPRAQPMPLTPVPSRPAQPRHDHGKDDEVDLGDVLKNLFKQRFR